MPQRVYIWRERFGTSIQRSLFTFPLANLHQTHVTTGHCFHYDIEYLLSEAVYLCTHINPPSYATSFNTVSLHWHNRLQNTNHPPQPTPYRIQATIAPMPYHSINGLDNERRLLGTIIEGIRTEGIPTNISPRNPQHKLYITHISARFTVITCARNPAPVNANSLVRRNRRGYRFLGRL